MNETTSDRTHALRAYLAADSQSEYRTPSSENPPHIIAVLLATLDHMHHLEERIKVLEGSRPVDSGR